VTTRRTAKCRARWYVWYLVQRVRRIWSHVWIRLYLILHYLMWQPSPEGQDGFIRLSRVMHPSHFAAIGSDATRT